MRMTVELKLAQQLHREYRAAEKALGGPKHFHDHGWEGCHKQQYFRKRAALLLRRSRITNPSTLGEAEQALETTVFIRRSVVMGVPEEIARDAYGTINTQEVRPGAMYFPQAMCTPDAVVKAKRDAEIRKLVWG